MKRKPVTLHPESSPVKEATRCIVVAIPAAFSQEKLAIALKLCAAIRANELFVNEPEYPGVCVVDELGGWERVYVASAGGFGGKGASIDESLDALSNNIAVFMREEATRSLREIDDHAKLLIEVGL